MALNLTAYLIPKPNNDHVVFMDFLAVLSLVCRVIYGVKIPIIFYICSRVLNELIGYLCPQ